MTMNTQSFLVSFFELASVHLKRKPTEEWGGGVLTLDSVRGNENYSLVQRMNSSQKLVLFVHSFFKMS